MQSSATDISSLPRLDALAQTVSVQGSEQLLVRPQIELVIVFSLEPRIILTLLK